MRQIEDRWRINMNDQPNMSESYIKILDSFKFNQSQLWDVSRYRSLMFKKYVNNKCSSVCLPNADYSQCFDKCVAKLNKSDNILNNSKENFEKEYNDFLVSGKPYFQS